MARLVRIGARLGGGVRSLVAVPGKVADPFYHSKAWVQLRERRKQDPDYAAAMARGPGERLVLDHKVERKDGGADLDPANTVWLTHSEHQAKTAKAKAARAGRRWRRGGGQKSGG